MKKTLVILILILIIATLGKPLYGQIIYYDAVFLRNAPKSSGKIILNTDVQELLANYLNQPSYQISQTYIDANYPIFKYFFVDRAAGFLDNSSFSSMIKTVGNVDVTNFADGLAKFLVERSKEELNVAFFRKFQDYIKLYPEVKIIFPTTYDFLNEIYSFQYTEMLPALKSAFQKDLNAFSTNLLELREISHYDGYSTDVNIKNRADAIVKFLNTPEGRSVIGAILVTNGIVKGNNAAEIINDLATDKICDPDDNISNILRFIDLLSESMRSNEPNRVWVTKQQVKDLVNDDLALRFYFGLIYAKDLKNNKHVQFKLGNSSVTLQDILIDLNNKWQLPEALKFKNSFAVTACSMSEVADNAKSVLSSKNQGDQPSILVYADYASSVADFLRVAVNFLSENPGISPALSGLAPEMLKFSNIIDVATSACYDLKSQNYGALVLHTSSMLSELIGTNYTYKTEFIKYGIFMANIIEAKNSDEVKAAIDAAVLPVGSSSIKRETNFNISLNAFIGPYAGTEYLPILKQDKWAFTTGLTAPVGIAFSWGKIGQGIKRNNGKVSGGKSVTVFIPVIDVGALASFRMGNDSCKVAAEIKLANIISPGLYLYYGFGKCPISVGLGGQLGPQLREVTATDINIDKNYYFRFGFNIVVDIPFFNLYTKN